VDKHGEYRLSRIGGGRLGFAHVFVHVTRWDHPTTQVVIDNAAKTAIFDYEPEWAHAALQGCYDAVQSLLTDEHALETYHIQITALRYITVDTVADAVRAAAFLATVMAFDKQDAFYLSFQDGWKISRSDS
jgi:hypothetical protein